MKNFLSLKIIFFILITLNSFCVIQAQSLYYYSEGNNKTFLNAVSNAWLVEFKINRSA